MRASSANRRNPARGAAHARSRRVRSPQPLVVPVWPSWRPRPLHSPSSMARASRRATQSLGLTRCRRQREDGAAVGRQGSLTSALATGADESRFSTVPALNHVAASSKPKPIPGSRKGVSTRRKKADARCARGPLRATRCGVASEGRPRSHVASRLSAARRGGTRSRSTRRRCSVGGSTHGGRVSALAAAAVLAESPRPFCSLGAP